MECVDVQLLIEKWKSYWKKNRTRTMPDAEFTYRKIFDPSFFVQLIKFNEFRWITLVFQTLVGFLLVHIPSTNHFQFFLFSFFREWNLLLVYWLRTNMQGIFKICYFNVINRLNNGKKTICQLQLINLFRKKIFSIRSTRKKKRNLIAIYFNQIFFAYKCDQHRFHF